MKTTLKEKSIKFWKTTGNSKLKLDIVLVKFIELLNQSGFANYVDKKNRRLVRIENHIVKEINDFDIMQFILEYVQGLPIEIENGFTREDLQEKIHRNRELLLGAKHLYTLQVINPAFKKDTSDKAFFYYKNCFLEVNKDGIEQQSYDKLDGLIWNYQILDREFKVAQGSDIIYKSDFFRFIFQCMGRSAERYKSLTSILGYLMHGYKDPANAVAIIFCDESISDLPEGGSGKSLTVKAIKQFKNFAIEDGKGFSATGNFRFQQVGIETDIILFEDAKKDFPFETLFAVITDGMTVERKYKNAFHLPFEDTPKVLITTNYIIVGNSSSFNRRKVEIEYASHYNNEHRPENEFEKRLFDEWGTEQWTLFDNLMMIAVVQYLKNGIITPKEINLSKRALLQETSAEFVEFADNIPRGVKHNKKELYENYLLLYPELRNNWFSQKKMTSWFRLYENYSKYIYVSESKSNSQYYLTIIEYPKPSGS